MSGDEQRKTAATLGAHDALLSVLLADYLARRTPDQRAAIKASLHAPSDIAPPPKLTEDLDVADQLAGMMLDLNDATRRIIRAAFTRLEKQK